ncbi:hypothetical protein GPALN_010789 [Globodera pallida]|nr:hypothetical protein GPALN_010789 [Globodera pallida]
MRSFHFLDAVCLFVVAAFILLETDASPKPSNTKLKNKGPTSSGNAKPNADASPKTSASNTKLENEPAEQENPGLTLGNHWNSKANACHPHLTLSEPVQTSDSTPSEPVQPSDPKFSTKGLLPIKYNKKKSQLTKTDADALHPQRTLSEPVQPSDSTPSKLERLLVVKHIVNGTTKSSSVFAVKPIPKTSSGTFYYEVKILKKPSFISIGLCRKEMPLDKEVGYFKGTYSYQSCGAFMANSVPMTVDSNGIKIPKIIAGNVVGCGVDFEKNNELFYTLNGKRLGTAGKFIDSAVGLFPCVTLFTFGDEIEANFGPDFVKNDLLPKD